MTHLDADARRRLRAYVRAHHPDVGGDPQAFAEGLLRLRADLAGPARISRSTDPDVVFYRQPRGLRAVLALIRQLLAARKQAPRVR
jgi:hypothetical protein